MSDEVLLTLSKKTYHFLIFILTQNFIELKDHFPETFRDLEVFFTINLFFNPMKEQRGGEGIVFSVIVLKVQTWSWTRYS